MTARREARSLRDVLRAKAHEHLIPLTVGIELTKRCNLRCVHCYMAGPRADMPTERVLTLFDELAAQGTMFLMLTGGELALHPDWLGIARGAHARGFAVALQTNGTLFSDDDLAAIAELKPARVSVSVYGGDAASHEAVTLEPGTYARSVHTLTVLTHLGVRTKISCPLMRGNVERFRDVLRLADQIGCEVQFDPNITPCQDGNDDVVCHRVPAVDLQDFFLERTVLRLSREGKVITADEEPQPREMVNCGAGFAGGFIEATGDVFPCAGFPPPFGNIHDAAFGDIWRGAAATAHRELMRAPIAECPECELNPYCTARCPRLALVEDGAVSGPSQRACELTGLCRDLRTALLRAGSCDINTPTES